MNYETLKQALTVHNPKFWVIGRKLSLDHGIDVWEYDFGGIGSPRVVIRGVDSNNPKLQFSSHEYGVFVDGKKLELENHQYLELLGQAGYLYAVVQPMKLKEQNLKR